MKLRAILTLCAVALTLAGCAPRGGQPSASTSTGGPPIVVGLTYQPDVQFAPFYVADAQGWFTQAGLDVKLRHHGASEQLFGAFSSGDEQVVFAGGDEMVQARSQGIDIVGFATIYQTYPVVLIVPADSPVSSLGDLRGRSVGVPGPFGENWFALQVMLASAGLTPADVNVVNIGYTQQAALTGRRVDAVVGFVNNDVVAFSRAGFPVRTLTTPDPIPLVGVGLGASPGLIAGRTDDLTTFMGVVRRGVQYCIDHPDEAVRLSASYVPNLTDADQQARALATLQATVPLFGTTASIGTVDAALWGRMTEFMQTQGLLAKPVAAADAATTTIAGARP